MDKGHQVSFPLQHRRESSPTASRGALTSSFRPPATTHSLLLLLRLCNLLGHLLLLCALGSKLFERVLVLLQVLLVLGGLVRGDLLTNAHDKWHRKDVRTVGQRSFRAAIPQVR